MLDDLKKEFEQIRQAIADGDRDAAIEMLSLRCTVGDPLHDSLILLETRLSNLQQSVIEGVISREDENIERNSTSKGLLQIVKALEARAEHPLTATQRPPEIVTEIPKTHPNSGQDATNKYPADKYKFDTRKLLITGSLLLAIAALGGIGNWVMTHRNTETQTLYDAKYRLSLIPSDIPIGPLGKVQIESGQYISEPATVPPDGVLLFKNTPIRPGKDSVKLRLLDFKYKHKIVQQSSDVHNGVLFHIILSTNTFSGKVLHPDLRPDPNVELEIEGGLARAVSDAQGNFSFVLPEWGATTVQLVMRRSDKVLLSRKMGLTPAVFKELKTPD